MLAAGGDEAGWGEELVGGGGGGGKVGEGRAHVVGTGPTLTKGGQLAANHPTP